MVSTQVAISTPLKVCLTPSPTPLLLLGSLHAVKRKSFRMLWAFLKCVQFVVNNNDQAPVTFTMMGWAPFGYLVKWWKADSTILLGKELWCSCLVVIIQTAIAHWVSDKWFHLCSTLIKCIGFIRVLLFVMYVASPNVSCHGVISSRLKFYRPIPSVPRRFYWIFDFLLSLSRFLKV